MKKEKFWFAQDKNGQVWAFRIHKPKKMMGDIWDIEDHKNGIFGLTIFPVQEEGYEDVNGALSWENEEPLKVSLSTDKDECMAAILNTISENLNLVKDSEIEEAVLGFLDKIKKYHVLDS